MENNTVLAAHEAEAMRQHSIIRWLLIIIVIQFVLFAGSWAGFIWYESQFETVEAVTEIDASQDGDGVNIVGGGNVEYGAESTYSNDNP